MRFLELNLAAFGPFTDTVIDLSGGSSGLHVIYGPNEAGKSTTLRAIHATLYGFPHTSKDNHLHGKPLVGAMLQRSDGQKISFMRRKGRKNTLLNPDSDTAYPEGMLESFLKGVDASTFQRVFGIDHDELQRGGNELRLLRGLLGDSLFAASLGGGSLARVLADLESEATDLFAARKKTSKIRAARMEYDQALKDKKEASIPFSRWRQLQEALDQAVMEMREIVTNLNSLRAQESRLERIRASVGLLAQRRHLREELAELGHIRVLPHDYSAEERSGIQGELARLNAQIESLQQELDGPDGLRQQRSRIVVDDAVLEQVEVVHDLQKRLGAHLKAARDRDVLRVRHHEQTEQAKRIAQDLGIAVQREDLAVLRMTQEQRIAILNLVSQEQTIRSQPSELLDRQREIERAIAANGNELDQLGQSRDTSEVALVCRQIRRAGDLQSDCQKLQQSVTVSQRNAERELHKIGLWEGSLSECIQLCVPLSETIDRFDERYVQLQQEKGQLDTNLQTTVAELSEITETISALQQAYSVPNEVDLRQARDDRDSIWKQLHEILVDSVEIAEVAASRIDPPHDSTKSRPNLQTMSVDISESIASFEYAISRADDIADRLRREAQRVEKLSHLQAREANLEQQQECQQQAIEDYHHLMEEYLNDWKRQWRTCGIEQPLFPREMRSWLSRHQEVCRLFYEMEQQQTHWENVQEKIGDSQKKLVCALKGLNESSSNSNDLHLLLSKAEKLIEREEKKERRREQLRKDNDALRKELHSLRDSHQQADERLKDWLIHWQRAMELIECSAKSTGVQANERLTSIDQMMVYLDDAEKIGVRIEQIDDDSDDFENRIFNLVKQISPDLMNVSAVTAAGQLQQKCQLARDASNRAARLDESSERVQAELVTASDDRDKLVRRLAQLCQIANVDRVEQLSTAEESSMAYVARHEKLQSIEQQLLDLSGGQTIEQMVCEARDQDVDNLPAQLEDVAGRVQQLERQRDEAAARVRELENESQAADSRTRVVEADERALGILGRIHRDVRQYVKLRMAAALLRQQIERHRAANQDPILAQAGELFSRITIREFSELKTDYDINDQPLIKGKRHNGELLAVDAMSSGTRDQLYLALRLAYLQKQLADREPMPFVADDILVHFDDDRASASLEILAELSHSTQIILFTHHRRIVELAEQNINEQTRFIRQLMV